MSQQRFLADMNVSPLTVSGMRQRGYDIRRVSDVLSSCISDEDILAWARREGCVIVTEDLDFSALLAVNGYQRPSVMSLRLSFTDPGTVLERLLHVLPMCEEALASGCVVSVDDTTIRIRQLPIG